jgi:hypothetical protein
MQKEQNISYNDSNKSDLLECIQKHNDISTTDIYKSLNDNIKPSARIVQFAKDIIIKNSTATAEPFIDLIKQLTSLMEERIELKHMEIQIMQETMDVLSDIENAVEEVKKIDHTLKLL